MSGALLILFWADLVSGDKALCLLPSSCERYGLDLKSGVPLLLIGVFILAVGAGAVGDAAILLPFGLESLLGGETFAAISDALANIEIGL